MTCYHPFQISRGFGLKRGKMVDPSDPYAIPGTETWVPCGRCIGCRIQRTREWACRCVFEAKFHEHNSFITLTYAPEYLPEDGSLHYEHFQAFMKRLRRRLDYHDSNKIRFFMCGEYGEKLSRPHYHAIIFGFDFPDKYVWSSVHGQYYYRSPLLEELWPFGFSTIGDVTFQSAAYVARYVTKKIVGKDAEDYYQGKKPEFCQCSRKPGIAREWIEEYMSDVYPGDQVVIASNIVMRPPRYFDRVFDLYDSDKMENIKQRRKMHAKELEKKGELSPRRLKVKEKCKMMQVDKLKRGYES